MKKILLNSTIEDRIYALQHESYSVDFNDAVSRIIERLLLSEMNDEDELIASDIRALVRMKQLVNAISGRTKF